MAHPPRALRAAILGVLAPLALSLAPLAAHAAAVTFSGGTTGLDPLGQVYATTFGPIGDPNNGGPNAFGFPTFGETFSTQPDSALPVFTGAPDLTHATSFTFTYTGTQSVSFIQGFDVGFTQFGGVGGWNTAFVNADTVEFTAPTGDTLDIGDNFDFIVGFTNTAGDLVIDPSQFSFTATWGGVPEPATWALTIMGLGAVGGALRTSRRKALLAAAV